MHGIVFLLPLPLAGLLPQDAGMVSLSARWVGLFAIETLLYLVGTAFIVMVLSKERMVRIHKTAASTDPLTGLFNRRAFFEAAEQMNARQVKRKEPISVLAFDLDHFKSINDRFGHAVGDKVLQIFAKTMRAGLRQTDLVGRLGGEEFTVVLSDASMDNAYLVADRLRRSFAANAAVIDNEAVHATASIGVSVIVDPRQDLAKLITLADQALYLAKARGRNRVEVAPIEVAEERAAGAAARQSAA